MATQPAASPAELKTVFIDGFEKGVTPEVLYNCLKKYNVKSIHMNKLQKSATAEFPSEAVAKEAINSQFGKPILKRQVRMSLRCDKAAITEFSLQGLEKVDLNKLYKITSKYGRSCKLGFNVSEKNKVVNRGYMSYTDFQADKEDALKKELLEEGVVCSPYNKTSKSYVRIDKFAEDSIKVDLSKKIEEYSGLIRTQLKELCNYSEGEYNISINAIAKGEKNEFYATVIFDNVEKAARFYDEINAIAANVFPLKPTVLIRVSEESETLTNLVAFGIKKPIGVLPEAFEGKVTDVFKKVFKGILQIKLREIRKKEEAKAGQASEEPSYLFHITMHSEEDGRELMANYLEEAVKKEIKEFFNAEPFINMFCSSAFRKEFKKAKGKYKRMEKDIKDSLDNARKNDIEMRTFNNFATKGGNPMGRIPMMNPNMPGPLPGGMPPGMGRMPMGPMSMGPMPGYPMGPISHMGPMGPMNPMMAPGINPMSMLNPADLVAKRREFLKDKDNINKDATIVKKVAIGYIITDLESLGMKESRRLAGTNHSLFRHHNKRRGREVNLQPPGEHRRPEKESTVDTTGRQGSQTVSIRMMSIYKTTASRSWKGLLDVHVPSISCWLLLLC